MSVLYLFIIGRVFVICYLFGFFLNFFLRIFFVVGMDFVIIVVCDNVICVEVVECEVECIFMVVCENFFEVCEYVFWFEFEVFVVN